MAQGWPPGGSASGWGEPGSEDRDRDQDVDPWSSPIPPESWGATPPDDPAGRPPRARGPWRRPARRREAGHQGADSWGAGGFDNGYAGTQAPDGPAPDRPATDGWGAPPPAPRPPRRGSWVAPVVVGGLALLLIGRLLGSVPDTSAGGGEPTAGPSGTGTAAALAGPGTYAFLRTLPDGSPVTFSSCRSIHYVVRPDNAPPQAERMLDEAVAAVAQASGLSFVDDGPTDEDPTDDRPDELPELYGPGPAPVLVTWSTPQEVPGLAGEVAGLAGPTTLTGPGAQPLHVSGGVYLDAEGIAEIASRHGYTAARAIVMHEFAHLVGLDHVDRRDQLMYPETVGGITTFQAGDLTGLRMLGQGPCVQD